MYIKLIMIKTWNSQQKSAFQFISAWKITLSSIKMNCESK